MNEKQLLQWLTLYHLPNLGAAKFDSLRQGCQGQWHEIFNATPVQLRHWGLTSQQISCWQSGPGQQVEKDLQWLKSHSDHFILSLACDQYPSQLRQLSRPPMLLFGRGKVTALQNYQFAIVGTRHPSPAACIHAEEFAAQLACLGWTITSGLALGIDGCAHRGALSVERPTIAVLGAGLDNVYPARHKKLAEQVACSGGCLLSEFAPGVAPQAKNFPRRNRIISGLSKGTLVVEAALKSGSLITARLALEQGREVFAMPGAINNPRTKGCHFLLKQGAKLVEQISDIQEEFQNISFIDAHYDEKKTQKSAEQRLATDKLLDSVDYEATAIDVIAERSGLPLAEVTATLLEYELRGLVATISGGYIKLRG